MKEHLGNRGAKCATDVTENNVSQMHVNRNHFLKPCEGFMTLPVGPASELTPSPGCHHGNYC